MTRGDKQAHTDKQKRQTRHSEEGERRAGRPEEDTGHIAWTTVNNQNGGGWKSGNDTKH